MLCYETKQRGFIIFGGGLKKSAWIARARSEGYRVLDCGTYAELY